MSRPKGIPWTPEQREQLRLRRNTPEAKAARSKGISETQRRLRETLGEEAYKARMREIGKKAALVRTRAPRAKRIFDQKKEAVLDDYRWPKMNFLVGDRIRMTDEAVEFFTSDLSRQKGKYSADTMATVVDIFDKDLGLYFWIHIDGEAAPSEWTPYWWEKKRGARPRSLPAAPLLLPAPAETEK
jgi:hypothetical protein